MGILQAFGRPVNMPSPTGVTAVLLVLGIALVSQAHAQAVNNAGTCPEVDQSDRSECPPPESQIGSCLIDSDCEGATQKCCSDGCNLICMQAKAPHKRRRGHQDHLDQQEIQESLADLASTEDVEESPNKFEGLAAHDAMVELS